LRPLGEETLSDLSKLVIDILLPFYLFVTTAKNATLDALGQAPLVLIAGLAIPVLSLIIAPVIYKPLRVPLTRQNVFSFSLMLANTAFLGIPVCEALFGPTGAFYAVIYDFGLTMIAFTFGIWLLSGGKRADWKSLVMNPLLLSVVLGLIVSAVGIQFPTWISQPVSLVGQATLPIALLVAGAQIGNIRFRKSTWNIDLIGLISLRLLIIPMLVFGVFLLSGKHNLTENVIIMEAAMPVAVSTTILAKRYEADAQFTATATLFSTLISILTLPLLALLIYTVA
jgi:predicted permease